MKINEKLLVTNFINPDVRFETQYGLVDGETWIKREAQRIGNCRVVVNGDDGFIALMRVKPGPEKNYEAHLKSSRWVKTFGKSR